MSSIPIFSSDECLRKLHARQPSFHAHYLAMYSSLLGGITTDPALMLIPLDDHMAHRGDGVFETVKCIAGAVYNLDAHLERLLSSAARISLALPFDIAHLKDAIIATLKAGGRPDALARVFLSRGPGSQGISPYECPEPAVYIVAYASKPPFMEQHPEGAKVIGSSMPVKAGFFATIKSVNYLPNVLLKKEAVDAGVDFAVNFDENGYLAEGATENMGLLSADLALRIPRPTRILPGTTMLRVIDLASALVRDGTLRAIESADIRREDLTRAPEAYIFGTTPDVTAVVQFDGRPVGDGKPGPIFEKLSELLRQDIRHNAQRRIPII